MKAMTGAVEICKMPVSLLAAMTTAAGHAMFSAFAASNEALLMEEIGAWLEAEAEKKEEDQ